MDRWNGRVAVVTGASSGIGLATAKALVREGLKVIGLARRRDKMISEMKNIEGPGKFYAKECDITKYSDIIEAFNFVRENFNTVHVLINNAGALTTKPIMETHIDDLQYVVNVNLMGLIYCSKEAIKMMKEHGDEAYIINISSTAGQRVPNPKLYNVDMSFNVYSPTKFAVRSFSEVLTIELFGNKIRVTNLMPGFVKTNILPSNAPTGGLDLNKIPTLRPEDVADTIIYLIGTPVHIQITELTLKSLGEIF